MASIVSNYNNIIFFTYYIYFVNRRYQLQFTQYVWFPKITLVNLIPITSARSMLFPLIILVTLAKGAPLTTAFQPKSAGQEYG